MDEFGPRTILDQGRLSAVLQGGLALIRSVRVGKRQDDQRGMRVLKGGEKLRELTFLAPQGIQEEIWAVPARRLQGVFRRAGPDARFQAWFIFERQAQGFEQDLVIFDDQNR